MHTHRTELGASSSAPRSGMARSTRGVLDHNGCAMQRCGSMHLTAFSPQHLLRAGVRSVSILYVAVALAVPGGSIWTTPTASAQGTELCQCGCGRQIGSCCCAAPKGSVLEMGCSNQPDPFSLDPPRHDRIGPERFPGLPIPQPSGGRSERQAQRFSGLGPVPETPPPRGPVLR